MTDSTYDRLKKIVVEQLGVSEEDVKPESSFVDDLNADSLDLVELIMSLEEEFGTEISDEEWVEDQAGGVWQPLRRPPRAANGPTSATGEP